MMRRLLLTIFAIGITTSIWAEPISREQALRQAQQFFIQKGKSKVLRQAETPMSKSRARGKQIPDYYYVFNAGKNEGFVIVSGDDRTPEILGYSDRGSFDLNQIPSNMEAWLQGYADQIKYVQDHQISTANRTRAIHRAPVAPMLTSHWDQHSPYSDDCGFDLSGFGHIDAVTGCVSIALAQIMYYYKYPAQTVAEIPSYQVKYNSTEVHTFESVPAGTAFDWENMLNSYPVTPVPGTEVQRAAVANLVSVVGRSIQTSYSNNNSSAKNANVAGALKNYFGYAQNVAYKQRWGYNNDEWEAILYQEMASGRPVLYGGQTSDDPNTKQGHSFVLDGYQDGGYFHVNWGWGQLNQSPDGYFLLSAMDPPLEGAGGGVGAYNYGQDAIVGIDYQDVGPVSETVRLATTSLTVNGSTEPVTFTKPESFEISFNVTSHLVNTYPFYVSLGLYQNDVFLRDLGKTWSFANFSPNAYNVSPLAQTFDLTALPNGQYKIIPISKKAETEEWYQNERSDEFFIILEVTDTQLIMTIGSQDDPEPEPDPEPEVSDADRAELASIYAALKTSVETIQASVTANETEIAALKASVTEKKGQITALNTKIAAIGEKLKNDLLTEEQKAYYTEQLSSLSDWCDQSELDVNDLNEMIVSLESANAALKTQLATLYATINTQAGGVAGITTAEALAASTSMANTLKAQVDGCDVTDVKSQIDDVKDILAEVSVAEIDASITEMAAEIDAVIEEAQKAAEEKEKEAEEKAQLEAAKKTLKESLDNLKKTADEKIAAVTANEQNITTLKTAIATAQETIRAIETKVAAIQEKLKSTYLTDAQKTDYTAQLTALEAEKTTYSTVLADLTAQLQAVITANSTLNTQLADIAKAIQVQTAAVDGISSKDALEAANAEEEKVKNQLDGVDPASVSNNLDTIKAALAGLSLASTSTALDNLETIVDKAIADAIAAAQSEKEKEELDAAKKDVQASLDVVKSKLAEAKDKIAKGENALAELDAAIKKGKETLAALKAKAAEIEALLAPSSARTRSNLTDDQRAAYTKQLQNLNAKIKELEDALAALTEAESDLEMKVKDAISRAQSVEDGINSTEKSLSTAATADAANALKATIAELETELSTIDTTANQVLTDITTQDSEMSAFEAEASAAVDNAAAIIEDVQNAISGIESVTLDENDIYGRYDLNGQRVDENYRGVMIIKMKNGKSQTIIKRK